MNNFYTTRDRSIDSEYRPYRTDSTGALITDTPPIVADAFWDDTELVTSDNLDEIISGQMQDEFMNLDRRLATIRRVNKIENIPGADFIEAVSVDGWTCVCKKGEFQVGDLAVYFEVDSVLPDIPVFEFLNGKMRLKTKKLKGVISQGLLLPLASFEFITDDLYDLNPSTADYEGYCILNNDWGHIPPKGTTRFIVQEGDDVTSILNVKKYVPNVPANLQGAFLGYFPSWITKTDEERVQNFTQSLEAWKGLPVSVTEKLDGSSFTAYMSKDEAYNDGSAKVEDYHFGVCSRNIDLKETEGNTFWQTARKLDLERKLRRSMDLYGLDRIVVQGEMVGPGIQKNHYGLSEVDLYLYNVKYWTREGQWEENQQGIERFCLDHDLKSVPRLSDDDFVCFGIASEWIIAADHNSALNLTKDREGIVVRHYIAGKKVFSFKAISNKFLLKHED